jgi:hypothetical protein
MVISVNDDAILNESLTCLRKHFYPKWGDRNLLDVFTRLLAKSIRPSGWTANTHLDLEQHQINSRREHWTTDRLGKLPLGHASSEGEDFDCSIIVAEYEGTVRLLDGNHRVNRWIAAGDTKNHLVNVHTVTGKGQFIDLPAVSKGA